MVECSLTGRLILVGNQNLLSFNGYLGSLDSASVAGNVHRHHANFGDTSAAVYLARTLDRYHPQHSSLTRSDLFLEYGPSLE